MLALASLATGFVVAAVSPSHAAPGDLPLGLGVDDTVSTLEGTVATESLTLDDDALGQLG
ncbi:Secreted protein OS=Streptomyces tendae OX=1932 GN=GUR47_28840 PE=4 SV=1 [Streptomyces tendae]